MAAFGALGYALRALRGSVFVTEPLEPRVRRDFRLDAFGALLFGVFNGAVISYLYVVGRTIGVSPFGISLLVAMPAIGNILSLPVSLAIQGQHARRFMLTAWALGRGLILLTLVFSSPLPYTIIVAIFLISTSIATPFYAAVMQHIYPRESRGRLMSIVRIGTGAVTTLTSLLVAWLLGTVHVHYPIVFAASTVAALVSLISFSRVTPVRPTPRPRQSLRATFAIVRQDRRFASFQSAVFIMAFGNIMASTLYPLVVVDKLHAGYGPFGVLTVCSALGYLISFFVWGRVVDRKGPLFVMGVVGLTVVTLPLGMLLAPAIWWLTPIILISGTSLAGFELGAYSAAIYYAPPHEVPRYMALHSYFAGIRGLIAPFLATTILAGHRYGLSLSVSLALTVTGTTLIWRGVRGERPAAVSQATAPTAPMAQSNPR